MACRAPIVRQIRLLNAAVDTDINIRIQLAAQEIINATANGLILASDITAGVAGLSIDFIGDIGNATKEAVSQATAHRRLLGFPR